MSWVNEARFYHIYPIGFCGAPKKNDGGEDVPRIRKLEEWIAHLTALQINAIYLGPIFESSEHGYDTSDYFRVDRRLGNNQVFKEVCKALHQNGIRIVLDGVFNHVGRDFWAFKDVREKLQNSNYCGWFQNLNFGGSSPCGDPFWYEGWQGHYNLVKLNLQNQQVVEHLLDAVKMWMDEFEIDGLRLDAADCVDPEFFRRLRAFCKQRNPDFWLMGEIIHGDYNHWANPSMLDSVTNYECQKGLYSSHNDKNYFEIGYSLNRQFGNGGIYKNLCLYNFVDNHDVNRLASFLRNKNHLQDVYTLLYTMPGVPSVYYGSEWGIEGTRHNNSDDDLRPCLTLGEIPNANEALCAHISRLGRMRAMMTALQYGGYEQSMLKNEQFVFCRMKDDHRVYVALNLADHPEYIEFRAQAGKLVDLFSGTSYESNDGNFKLELPAYGTRILSVPDAQCEQFLQADTQPYQPAVQKKTADTVSAPADAVSVPPAAKQEPKTAAINPSAANPVSSPAKQSVPPVSVRVGRYRHFKGNEYEVLAMAKHSETLEDYVIYRALYGEREIWIRPAAMFAEKVQHEGKLVDRFTFLA